MTEQDFDNLQIGVAVELTISGVVTTVLGVDYDDRTFMDHCGGWTSFEDAELIVRSAYGMGK